MLEVLCRGTLVWNAYLLELLKKIKQILRKRAGHVFKTWVSNAITDVTRLLFP